MENQNKYLTKVRDSYAVHEHTKLDELKTLDKKVKTFPTVFAYVFGTVAVLILGTGMCLALKVIGAGVLSSTAMMAMGVVIGCVGIAGCIANYFIYKALLKSRKRKYGSQIVSLAGELLNQN